MGIGIISFGSYIPRLRLGRGEYQKAWGSCAADIKEKAVMDYDEDTLTMGIEAAKQALRSGINPLDIQALALASTTFPYEEKVLSGTFAGMLGLPEKLFCSEHGQSTRAGTEALLSAVGVLREPALDKALVIAADAPSAQPKDTLEHGLGAGSAAVVLGKENIIAEIEHFNSFVSESMGERFRLEGNSYLTDIGVKGFTGIAFTRLVSLAVKDMLAVMGRAPADYRFLIIQENDGKTPKSLGKKLGFSEEQMTPGLIYAQTGDTGASSVLLSLTAVLEQAKPEDNILLVSYGSGAGSQAISLKVTSELQDSVRGNLQNQLSNKRSIDYVQYLKLKRQIL